MILLECFPSHNHFFKNIKPNTVVVHLGGTFHLRGAAESCYADVQGIFRFCYFYLYGGLEPIPGLGICHTKLAITFPLNRFNSYHHLSVEPVKFYPVEFLSGNTFPFIRVNFILTFPFIRLNFYPVERLSGNTFRFIRLNFYPVELLSTRLKFIRLLFYLVKVYPA